MIQARIFAIFLAITFPLDLQRSEAGEPKGLPTSRQPNDCAIVATEAYHRLAPNATWARLLCITFRGEDGAWYAHMMVVWQYAPDMPILIYDDYFIHSTLELGTRKREASVITAEFGKCWALTTGESRFVQ